MTEHGGRRRGLVYGLSLAVILLALVAVLLQWRYQEPPLPKIKALPEFELVERSGAKIHLSDLKGTVWLADFIYSTCPGPCPMISSHFEALQRVTDPRVRFVSITMDPANDSPAVLQKYAERFHAPADRWLFLTGAKDTVQQLVRDGFLLAMADAQVQPKQPILHSTKLALVDKQGVIRAFYEGVDDAQNEQILRDIRRLERE